MRLKAFFIFTLFATLLLLPPSLAAWGQQGHRIVGAGALLLLDDSAHLAVKDILGGEPETTIGEACFWPDTVRETPEWGWSSPMHYVNIPHSALHYERQRDCPDGMCVTEAILKYASELSRPGLKPERRRQAFSWLCHLVGDLHQPFHAGYRDDRGGNSVEIEYLGEAGNLHQFWDRMLIRSRLGQGDQWSRPDNEEEWLKTADTWDPADVAQWTDESHSLVNTYGYPAGAVIDQAFADQAWLVIRQQWQKASHRLALILNTTLGE